MRRIATIAAASIAIGFFSPAMAEIVIGAAGQITGQGAWQGQQQIHGAEMAIADITAAGGVLGQPLRLITADDFCDPAQAVAAAQKLVGDGVAFVVGHGCSGASIPASKVYEAAGVIQISPSSTNPMLTDQGRANVFRTIGRDDMQGRAAGDYLAEHWAHRKIAILNDGTTYGKGLADETRRHLNKRGVVEAIFGTYEPGKDDYSEEVAALQAANVAALYVGGYPNDIGLMARTAHDRGYSVQIVSADTIATEEFSLVAGPAADGVLFTFVADPRKKVEAMQVVERFRAENIEPDSITLLSYAAVQAWAQAVEKVGTLEPSAVIKSLHENQFDTVLGRIDFDDKGDLTAQNWVWYVWQGGEYTPLEK